MKLLFTAFLLLIAAPAFAQQQASPPETALQINGIIGSWAQNLVQQGKMIDELQGQLAKAQVRIKELEAGAAKPKD